MDDFCIVVAFGEINEKKKSNIGNGWIFFVFISLGNSHSLFFFLNKAPII